MVAIFGCFFSFALLMPLLMICGPTGKQGDLDELFACCSKSDTKSKASESSSTATV